MASMIGGGSGAVRPGAVSRAHRGVLFLDEAPEFRRDALDGLRQPLESGEVVIARADRHVRLPARFQLVLAANPCPCGGGGRSGCTCAPARRVGYLGRLSGPLLDRMDLRVAVRAVARSDLALGPGESSVEVRARVATAREAQRRRWSGQAWSLNSEVPGAVLRSHPWQLDPRHRSPLDRGMDSGALTLRGLDRCLRMAWTLGDLAGLDRPGESEVLQALALRQVEGVKAA